MQLNLGPAALGVAVAARSFKDEMDAYDSLPQPLRVMIDEGPYKISATSIKRIWQQTQENSPPEIAQALTERAYWATVARIRSMGLQ